MPNQLLQNIEAELAAINFPNSPEGLYEPIRYVLEGRGKRLRPTLLLMTYGLYCPENIKQALPAAVGIEMYHNHTLLHDDLMDRSDMRHGRPTVHRQWNDNTAILSGDTMLIMAFEHIMACQTGRREEALRLFARSAREICEGQQYDINFESRTDVTIDEYLEMIRLKTSVLLACAAKTGALLANAPEDDAEALYTFAEKIGLAFQLQDDYLDVYGDPTVFGKKTGGDILCGKKTYLLINALNLADNSTREQLLSLLGTHDMPASDKIKAVTDIYNNLGIDHLTREAIENFYYQAHSALKRIKLCSNTIEPLWKYAETLLDRKK